MNILLQLEEFAQFLMVIAALHYQSVNMPWWAWLLLFFAPDLGMVGYLFNPSAGAITYNLLHHKLIAIVLIAAGYFLNQPMFLVAGLIIYGHSSFDRALGYGLKYSDAFKHTHLGWIGN